MQRRDIIMDTILEQMPSLSAQSNTLPSPLPDERQLQKDIKEQGIKSTHLQCQSTSLSLKCVSPPPPPPSLLADTPPLTPVFAPLLTPPLLAEKLPLPYDSVPPLLSDVRMSRHTHDLAPLDMLDMLSSRNFTAAEDVDEDEPVGICETIPDCVEGSSSDEDEIDFTDADVAIDKMLDELQALTRELGRDIPENNKGDFDMLSPTQKHLEPPLLDDTKVELLRSQSIASIADIPEIDLDALLADLFSLGEGESSKATLKRKIAENGEDRAQHSNVHESNTPSSLSRGISSSGTITHDVKERLETLQTELESKELCPEEQQAQIKAEKIKIALEKMKAASFQELFIKVYNKDERTNKTMMIDQTWTARDVRNKMMLKDNVEPGPNWSIIEKLPELSMERILEDSEYVLQTVLDWSRETENVLVFLNRRDKYMLFRNPKNFLLTTVDGYVDEQLARKSKDVILQEFFTKESTRIPKTPKTFLWLKEGRTKWVKHYFSLRVSGIYYTPKGKQMSDGMTCLASFEHMNVYQGVGFKRKFKSPTDHVFCLKHPKVQTIKSKHIYCFCAETAKMKEYWITVVRMAKYGYTMYENYLKTQEELEGILQAMSGGTLPARDSLFMDEDETISCIERGRSSKKGAFDTVVRVEGKRNSLGTIFSTAWIRGIEHKETDNDSVNDSKRAHGEHCQELCAHRVPDEETYFTGLCGHKTTSVTEPNTTSPDFMTDPFYMTMSNGLHVPPPPPPPPQPLLCRDQSKYPPIRSTSEQILPPVYEEVKKPKANRSSFPISIHSNDISKQPSAIYGQVMKPKQ